MFFLEVLRAPQLPKLFFPIHNGKLLHRFSDYKYHVTEKLFEGTLPSKNGDRLIALQA